MIKASTPGLDAMKAKQGTSLLDDKRAEDAEKKKQAELKLAEQKSEAKANRTARRVQRELRRAEITGRVSNFLRDWASRNAAVNQAVNAKGATVNVAQLPGVGTLDVDTGKILSGPLFESPTSKVEIPKDLRSNCALGLAPNGEGGVIVLAGLINGELPPGFDAIEGKDLGAISGDVYAEVEIDDETGEVSSVDVKSGGTTPQNTDTKFYLTLGFVSTEDGMVDYGCGNVEVRVCRNWFAAEKPFFGVNLVRCCNAY